MNNCTKKELLAAAKCADKYPSHKATYWTADTKLNVHIDAIGDDTPIVDSSCTRSELRKYG